MCYWASTSRTIFQDQIPLSSTHSYNRDTTSHGSRLRTIPRNLQLLHLLLKMQAQHHPPIPTGLASHGECDKHPDSSHLTKFHPLNPFMQALSCLNTVHGCNQNESHNLSKFYICFIKKHIGPAIVCREPKSASAGRATNVSNKQQQDEIGREPQPPPRAIRRNYPVAPPSTLFTSSSAPPSSPSRRKDPSSPRP